MIHAFWSLKGGSGTTTTAIAIGLRWARAESKEVLLVDTQGDIPHAIGLAEPGAKGISEWLTQNEDLSQLEYQITSKLSMLPLGSEEVAANPEKQQKLLEYLTGDPREIIIDCGCMWRHEFSNPDMQSKAGSKPDQPPKPNLNQPPDLSLNQPPATSQLETASSSDAANPGASNTGFEAQFLLARALLEAAQNSVLVTKSCFLALRRISRSPWQPTGVILLMESGRALAAGDVTDLAKCPVIAQLEVDVRVGRAIDAGLLASDLPKNFSDTLADLPLLNT